MTSLDMLLRVTMQRAEEMAKPPHERDLAKIEVCRIYLDNFAPKAAHDFVTCSQPPEKED